FRWYSNAVSPDRSTLRTVLRDTFRSRAISLIVLPLIKCSRRIRPIVSTVSIPPHRSLESERAAHQANLQGVNFGRRSPDSGGQNCTPNDKPRRPQRQGRLNLTSKRSPRRRKPRITWRGLAVLQWRSEITQGDGRRGARTRGSPSRGPVRGH